MTADDTNVLPVTVREPVRGARWGREAMELSGLERLRASMEGRLPDCPSMRLAGLKITDVNPGMVTCVMPASPWWKNSAGVFPGGTLAYLADVAVTGAAMSTVPPFTAAPTSQLSVDFLRTASVECQTIIARGRLSYASRTLGLAEVSLEDGRGRTLGRGSGRAVFASVDPELVSKASSQSTAEDDDRPDPYLLPVEGEIRGEDFWDKPGGDWVKHLAEGSSSPFMTLLGIRVVDAADGKLTVAMQASEWFSNFRGSIYGGALACLAEAVCTGAVITTLPPHTACGALDLKVNFLRPARPHDGEITAHAEVVRRGRMMSVVHCEISAEGKLVGLVNQSELIVPGRSRSRPIDIADEVIPSTD